MQRRYEATAPVSPVAESSSVAAGKRVEPGPPEIMVESPRDSQVHPALREEGWGGDAISHA